MYKFDTVMSDWTPLHVACWENNIDEVKKQLAGDTRVNVNAPLNDGLTPLHIAAHGGHSDIIKHLIDAGADVTAKIPTGSTPLYLAARNGFAGCVKVILERSLHLRKVPDSVLCAAASNGHVEVVRVLLEDGRCNIDARTDDGSTALWIAALQGHNDVVQKLVQHGADVNACTHDGRSALYAAAYRGHAKVVETLLKAGADPSMKNSDASTPVHMACYEGHSSVVDVFLQAGLDLTLSSNTVSPLELAQMKNHQKIVAAIKFYKIWPKLRLLWIGQKKNRSMAYTQSTKDSCYFAWLPRDIVSYITTILHDDLLKQKTAKA